MNVLIENNYGQFSFFEKLKRQNQLYKIGRSVGFLCEALSPLLTERKTDPITAAHTCHRDGRQDQYLAMSNTDKRKRRKTSKRQN